MALFGPTTAVQRCKTGYKGCYNVVLCCIRPSLMSPRLGQSFRQPCQRFIEKEVRINDRTHFGPIGPNSTLQASETA